ncbi:hypothetical protein RHSIM_Rhsim03G0221600 [Rhododendron simsii]|uniref:FAS1 domain-containing protein n=1 Tax=Rhododendron simsii TaxID=118357 RepID=A0A834LR47_RHOSS|nr:hypothetical protein RHSIM_Rhsim03G0221600 [Rhododendron simsii]
MAYACMTLLAVLMALVSSTRAQNNFPPINHDLLVATQEMQMAKYFTFVMLINMAPGSLTQGNVTFLVPNDWTLAQTQISESDVVDFLLRHSIPSPLLFEHLVRIPTGSVIPTGKPDFLLRIFNNGMRSFYLNNVQIVSPDICTKGSSFRCHGIDRVVQAIMVPGHNHPPLPPPSASNSSSPAVAAAPPALCPSPAPHPPAPPPLWPSPAPHPLAPPALRPSPAPHPPSPPPLWPSPAPHPPSPPPLWPSPAPHPPAPPALWPSPAPLPLGGVGVPPLNIPPPSPPDQNGGPLKSGSSQPLPSGGLPLGFVITWLIFSRQKFRSM